MLKEYIKIKASEDEHGADFWISASNGSATCELQFYHEKDCFLKFAEALLNFPGSVTDKIIFEASNPLFELKILVYCYDFLGHSALQIIMDNKEKAPETQKAEFYIKTIPGSLNRLGDLLKNWDFLNEGITWIPE